MAAAPGPGGFGKFYVITALINAATSTYNSAKSRQQQEALAEKNRALTESMEKNRQKFQIEQSERNAQLQKELSLQNHALRLQEQKANFQNFCDQVEWQRFMSTWPLQNVPKVLRDEQLLPDGTVSLRVFFSKSNDPVFAKAVYPKVEQGLREFVEIYHNRFGSKNILFYHNAFTGTLSGGAAESNIHFALKELPVVIIDTNVLMDEIVVSLTMWGLGSSDQSHFTVFRMPYQQKTVDGNYVKSYYMNLAAQLLARLKFVMGYAYDAYNLIQYDRPPLLPQVAAFEKENGAFGIMLDEPEVNAVFADKYGEIYDCVIGSGEDAFAQLPESFKQTNLYELRLEYAEAVKGCVSAAQYVQYLDESLDAWVDLRSTLSKEVFLKESLADEISIRKYFTKKDKAYFEKMKALYSETGHCPEMIVQACERLAAVQLTDGHTAIPIAKSAVSTQPSGKRRKIEM